MKTATYGRLATRTLLFGFAVLATFNAVGVAARVGVTSATDGTPLGKPPQAVERVLHVGIDVQANELITTKADDRAQLLFIDGTTLTVGPNAQLTIDKFVYDPTTKKGELALNMSKGVLRVVGGKISKSEPITVTTPSATMGIRGGIALLEAKAAQSAAPAQTTGIFVFGEWMDMKGVVGATKRVYQPGFQVTVEAGAAPGDARADPRVLSGLLMILAGSGNAATVAALMDAISNAGITNAALVANVLSALGDTQNRPTNLPLATLLATVNQAQNTNASGSPN